MKRCQKDSCSFLSVLFSMVMALLLAACGGGGGSESAPPATEPAASTTTISGKVTLSSTVTAKPTMMAAMINKARLKQANKSGGDQDAVLLKALSATTLGAPTALTAATIELYDADKPNWLYPVAVALSDSTGSYTLSALQNAASNLKADGTVAYKDGDPVPVGNYTIIASKYDTGYGKLFVAVQAVVKKFSGAVVGNDLVAQDSTAVPTVSSMLGLSKNADGSFGSSTTLIPVNANIQVTFSMAMARQSVLNGMKITAADGTVVSGKWKVSPDLTAVTFSPDADLTPNTVYTITVGGGKSLKTANNVYGKPIAADVKCTFKSSFKDSTPPSVIRNSPTSAAANSMPITTPIRIGADEEIDITSIAVTSNPSIGDRPAIKFVGKSTAAADANFPFVYEIVPSEYLKLGTTYAIGVSGGLDMAGNAMVGSTAINFTTEASSAGVTGTTTTEINAQLAAKDVLGKWVSAMNARNSSLLASYMSGDFFWVNGGTNSTDDLNRDGRLSLAEFTGMLNTWFKELDRCGSTVEGVVDTANANVAGGIAVNASTAVLAFNLKITPTNTTDSTCSNSGPKSAIYAVMENINQAWLMTRGSDMYLATYPVALAKIDLAAPANGNQFPEPTALQPVTPEFKWTAIASDAAGTPMSTYLVVLIDNKSRQLQTGWAALVDGTSSAVGSPVSAKFNGTKGDYGNMIVIDTNGGNNPLGFNKMITEIKPGGSYSWAVIGFKTKLLADFKNLNFSPALYLAGSSVNNGFTVAGVWKELKVTVAGSPSNTPYAYSDGSGGYNVGAEDNVTLTITTPNTTGAGTVSVNGYTYLSYPLAFTTVGGVNTATVTVPLSNKRNWVCVEDGAGGCGNTSPTGGGLSTEFGVFTTGGALPKINVTSVSGKTCAPVATATLGTQDNWGNYTTADTCTVDITGTVDATLANTTLYLNLRNNNGNGNYRAQVTAAGTAFSLTNVPVYKGYNWINLCDTNNCSNSNGFGVDTLAGATYVPPIAVSLDVGSKTSENVGQSSWWDVGSAASVNLSVTMTNGAGMNPCSIMDSNWMWVSSCTISGTGVNVIPVALLNGWNYVSLNDSAGNWYSVSIYTTGGTVIVPQNAVTSITDGTNLLTTTPSYGYYQYPAGGGSTAACSVTITGATKNAGSMNVYLNSYNSMTSASVNEYQMVTPATTPNANGTYNYSFSRNVYAGSNSIDIYDSMWNWQGVQVSSTCTTAPVVFGVTSVQDGATALTADMYGTYNATGGSLQVTGAAKATATVTAYVSGMYYGTVSTTAGAGNTYTLSIPIYTGYNYIALTDGFNWVYLNASTTSGSVYTQPINAVTVAGSTLASGGAASDNWSSWNTSLGSVDISGKATVNGPGTYYLSGATSTSGTFTAVGGAFTLPSVALSYGYNYLTLYDANWNTYYLTIYTTGGAGAPAKIISITSPQQSGILSGAVTVTGTVDVVNFAAAYVRGYVYDYTTGMATYYSSNSADWAYGDQPLTYNAATGAFSFNTSITAGNTTLIEAYAVDANWTVGHANGIYVNNTMGQMEYFYKPGSKASAASSMARAHKAEFAKKNEETLGMLI